MLRVRLTLGERAGEVIDADSEAAHAWVLSGYAELVTSEPVETPERAASHGVETRRRPGRPRKSAE